MTTAPELCERLAALLRAGYNIRAALAELPARIESPSQSVVRCARLATLGASFDRCVAALAEDFGSELDGLAPLLNASASSGSNTSGALDRLAEILRGRESARRDATVAAAGAKMSARTIGALPLMMIPVALRQVGDPLVVVALGSGSRCGYADTGGSFE